MNIRLLKLSRYTNKQKTLNPQEIMDNHYNSYLKNGMVTYSTDIYIKNIPDYTFLIVNNKCYKCHVKTHYYNYWKINPNKEINNEKLYNSVDLEKFKDLYEYSLDEYKDDDNRSWLLFDSIEEISINSLEKKSRNILINFIKKRSNNKIFNDVFV